MSGYSNGGASLNKKTMKTWLPISLSAKSDIDLNLSTLRNRSRDLATNSALGSAVIQTLVTGVIGAGLKLFPRIDANYLGISSEEAREISRQIKREFELWAENCDYLRRNNFYELQLIAFESSLIDGDSFVLFKRDLPKPYSLRLQVVESARVSNPDGGTLEQATANGGRIVNGIETDRAGRLESIYVSNRLWNEPDAVDAKLEWQRVKVFGEKTGCRNVLQICRDVRPDQNRGVPVLAPVIENLKQIERYADAELTSSIIKSFFSVFFIQPTSNLTLNEIAGEEEELDVRDFKLGAGTISALPKGVDVKAIDSQNSQKVFESFMNFYVKTVGAAVNLPYEVLLKTFQSSYSASRAALLQAASEFEKQKTVFCRDFLTPIYENFLAEAVALGRLNLPGFFNDILTQRAWSRAQWYSKVNRVLDAQKETNAAKTKLELGLTSREKVLAETEGIDFEDLVETLAQEKVMLEKILPAQSS